MQKRQLLTLALAAAAGAGFAAPAAALTVRDFGPVGASANEIVRLAVKSAAPSIVGVGVPFYCQGRLLVSSGSAPPVSAPFNLYAGQAQMLDVDPAQLGPPLPISGTVPPMWELAAVVVLDGTAAAIPGADKKRERACAKSVTAAVQILDRATGEIRRVDKAYTETSG